MKPTPPLPSSLSLKLLLSAAVAFAFACSGAQTGEDEPSPDAGTQPQTDGGTAQTGPRAADFAGLVINEVVAAGDPDWFELYNRSDRTLDLSQLTFTDDVTVPTKGAFAPGTTLAPGAYLRIDVADEGAGFKLGGDELVAVYAGTGLIDEVDWDEGDAPKGKSFGRMPDGTGPFMTLDTPTPGAPNAPNMAAPVCGDAQIEGDEVCDGEALAGETCVSRGYASGTLGCDTSCRAFDESGCEAATADVVINEVSSAGDDEIELFNLGTAAQDLGGWSVADSDFDPSTGLPADHRYVFPAGTTIAPGAYLVLVKDTHHPFGLGGSDSVRLFNAQGEIVDQIAWTSGQAIPSFCRTPNGTGGFQTCAASSFGAANP